MKRLVLAIGLLISVPAAAAAQSLFSTRGLGVPADGIDARARALGVNGVGLLGLSTSQLNPAEAGGTLRRGLSASFQPWSASVNLNGEEGTVGGTRFPLITVLYPVRRMTFTLGYSGQFDQSWAIFAEDKQLLGSDSVDMLDLVQSVGGIGELKLGVAYMVNPHVAVGVSGGLLTGSVDRTVTRQFPDTALHLRPFVTTSAWEYSGPLASVGVRWDPNGTVRAGASLTWNGTLDAKPKEGSTSSHNYDMPLRLAAGVSARVSSRLFAAASATISSFDGDARFSAPGTNDSTVADRAVQVGGGLEWSELRSGSRVFPLRLGFRVNRLPFHNENEASAKEWAVSGGIGLRLVEDDFGPLAVADLGFERGKRDGWAGPAASDGLSESFWRFTATISLFGR